MVFIFEIRNENKIPGEIFVRFKVVNENDLDGVIPCEEDESDTEGQEEEVVPRKISNQQLLKPNLSCKEVRRLYEEQSDSDGCLDGQSLHNLSLDSENELSISTGTELLDALVNSNNNGDGDSGESVIDGNGNQSDNATIILPQAVSHAGSAKVPAPTLLPKCPNVMDLSLYLARIQQYFNQLGYHRQGEPKIRVLTNMSVKHQVETARSLIKAGEAIKCLHALVLAIHLTNCSNHIERFPINFKSDFNGKEYKHVVLGVYLYGLFGALGISRDPGLQDKPIAYPRLLDLILDYHRCYSESGHILREVKIGGVITHDPHSCEPINWRIGSVLMEELNPSGLEVALEKVSKQLRSKMGSTCLRNVRPTQMVFPSSGEQPISPTATPPRVLQAKKSKTVASINSSLKKVNKK